MNSSNIFPFVVADIGGTNARFGLITGAKDSNDRFTIVRQFTYTCSEFSSFEKVFENYIHTIKNENPRYACIAIAAPVTSDFIQMTNLNWRFSITDLCKKYNMDDIHVINDFGALAYSTLYLQEHELKTLNKSSLNNQETTHLSRAIIGPGTGLGVAGLIKTHSNWQPICGEGGHASFTPLDEEQSELRQILLSRLNTNHLSIENLISGPGLVNLYDAICTIEGKRPDTLTAAQISKNAKTETDQYCTKALNVFTKVLGASTGDIALTMGAFGGVYLSGGILPKIINDLDTDLLIEQFLNKGIKQDLLKSIPVHIVLAPIPALAGAGHWMYDQLNSRN